MFEGYYYDEAVGTTDRLHDEIQALKAEKGDTHFVESKQPRNPRVADRNALRCAVLWLKGEPTIPATFEALRELRPHGFMPHVVAGKVWLKRKFVPLSEEEAVRPIEIQDILGRLDLPVISSVMAKGNVAEPNKPSVQMSMKGLVPTQIRKPPRAIAQEQRAAIIVAVESVRVVTKSVTRRLSCGFAQQAAQPIRPPPYESRFLEYNRQMTEEMYNNLEDDNKMDFIQVFVNGGRA